MTIDIEFQPLGRKISVAAGSTVLGAARQAGIGLLATCGGQASCGSCIVQLTDPELAEEPSAADREHLSTAELLSGYRLACRTRLFQSTVISVPPKSLGTLHRLQIEGHASDCRLDPQVRIHDIRLDLLEGCSDHEISRKISQAVGSPLSAPELPGELLTRAKLLAKQNQHNIRIIYHGDRILAVLPPLSPVLGLAVDIGTTKVAAYLLDLESGTTLAKDGCINPQVAYGDDVMARITHALGNPSGAETLQAAILDAINKLTHTLCISANSLRNGTSDQPVLRTSQIHEAVLVGNTAMHHLCLGFPLEQLGRAPYRPAVYDALELPASCLALSFAPDALVHTLPNVAGFVGADHVSMLLAAGVLEETRNTLFMDIGTNTEMTLLIDGRMLCCSTASGPAFEGAHIRDGMRAAEGAIEKIRIIKNSVYYQTIGNTPPLGICGSGILDAIAEMRRADVLNSRGGFNSDHPLVRPGQQGAELLIAPAAETARGSDICVCRKDISEIQLAKGAMAAGLDLLLAEAGHKPAEIEKVVIAGAFGSFIDTRSAITIGLFPDLPADRFFQIGNAAGTGAQQSLLSRQKRAETAEIAKRLEYIELAGHPGFAEVFARAMLL